MVGVIYDSSEAEETVFREEVRHQGLDKGGDNGFVHC